MAGCSLTHVDDQNCMLIQSCCTSAGGWRGESVMVY